MSESAPKVLSSSNNMRTIMFMVILSFVCAVILSVMASVLSHPILVAKDLDRSKQMLIAAKILSHDGYFLVRDESGNYVPAKYEKEGVLVPSKESIAARKEELINIYKERLIPMLVDDKGNIKTFKEAHINEEEYLTENRKAGYYLQPFKLIYLIRANRTAAQKNEGTTNGAEAPKVSSKTQGETPLLPSKTSEKIDGYVIPINGYGLWDAIYGYLAIAPDGNTIIGMTWYDQKETPGLGANIADAPWQNLFFGKQIFQPGADGKVDFKTAPLGITVVKGKVSEVLGDVPKAKSAVDGMAGATLTGNGVNDAFKNVLAPYRPFLLKLQNKDKQDVDAKN